MHFIDYDPEGRIRGEQETEHGSFDKIQVNKGWNNLKRPLLLQLLRESCDERDKCDAWLNYEFEESPW